jgi:hypothetical protein
MNLQEIETGIIFAFSRNAALRVLYRDLTMGGVRRPAGDLPGTAGC